MSDSWSLIISGRLEDAVIAYSQDIQAQDSSFSRRNRATALMLLGRLEDAFRDMEAAESLSPSPKGTGHFSSDGDQIRLGVIEWLSGKRHDAVDRWLQIGRALLRGRVQYTDASGGIGTVSILRFGAVHLHRDDVRKVADKLLAKVAKRPTYNSWPLPIAGLYLGVSSATDILSRVSETPVLHDRQLCQARFAIAVTHLEAGDSEQYATHMAQAATFARAIYENEWFLACLESRQDNGISTLPIA